MTGYPMTMRGEFQLAALGIWRGTISGLAGQFFCAPLIILGLLWSPSRTFAAYKAGQRSESLYGVLDELEG